MATDTISLVIPALNEERGVVATVERAPKDLLEVIVVDGGSKDDTVARARAAGAQVIVEPRRGYGRAYKAGFAAARGDLIATADADGTYPVEMIPHIAEFLRRKNLMFVSCSRFPLADIKSMKVLNKYGNVGMSLAATLLYLHPFRDIASGMWVFRRSLLEQIDLDTEEWCFSNEIKLEAYFTHPRRFAEFVIPYEERVGHTHNVAIWKTGFEVLGFMTYKRLQHFVRSRVADPHPARRAMHGDPDE
ncbi:MAG: glycosyltransferase family 2 protein [Sorangiineae bacterium]|nr:glycosyltransferase family 2 protein [Polyangiaceae bacterium]MEB2322324.1 glycosyltransferase family 2 protein [Sorangiineae bacterium]